MLSGPKPMPIVASRRLDLPPLPQGARVTHIGVQGPVIDGLQGRPQEAIQWLRDAGAGDVRGLLDHPDVPGRPIDLPYGDEASGLAHIDMKHPGAVDTLPDVWSGLKVVSDPQSYKTRKRSRVRRRQKGFPR